MWHYALSPTMALWHFLSGKWSEGPMDYFHHNRVNACPVESCLYADRQGEFCTKVCLGTDSGATGGTMFECTSQPKSYPWGSVFSWLVMRPIEGHQYLCVLSLLLLSFHLHVHLVPRAGRAETANFLCSHNTNQIYFSFEASYIWFWHKIFHQVMNYFYKSRTMSCLSGFSARQLWHFLFFLQMPVRGILCVFNLECISEVKNTALVLWLF